MNTKQQTISGEKTLLKERNRKYLNDIGLKIDIALSSPNVKEGVKDCIKTIITEAATEASYVVNDFSFARIALPHILDRLDDKYGLGFIHSIDAILRYDTDAEEQLANKKSAESEGLKKLSVQISEIMNTENKQEKIEKEMKSVEITIYTDWECEKDDTSEMARMRIEKSCLMASSLFHLIEISCMNYEQLTLGEASSKFTQEHLESIRIVAELGKKWAYQI